MCMENEIIGNIVYLFWKSLSAISANKAMLSKNSTSTVAMSGSVRYILRKAFLI